MPNTIVTIDNQSERYLMWDLAATAGTGASSPGIINGGKLKGSYKATREQGVSSQESIRAEGNQYEGTGLKFAITVDTVPLLRNAQRSGSPPALPLLKIHGGTKALGWAFGNVIINKTSVGFSGMNAAVDATVDVLAANGTKGSGLVTQAALTGSVFTAMYAIIKINGVDYIIQKAQLDFNNNASMEYHAGPKATGFFRDPTIIHLGKEEHEVKFNSKLPLPGSCVQDLPSAVASAQFGFSDANSNWLLYTYSSLTYSDPMGAVDMADKELSDFDYTFLGSAGSLTMATTAPI